jgi:hypothetical protein
MVVVAAAAAGGGVVAAVVVVVVVVVVGSVDAAVAVYAGMAAFPEPGLLWQLVARGLLQSPE